MNSIDSLFEAGRAGFSELLAMLKPGSGARRSDAVIDQAKHIAAATEDADWRNESVALIVKALADDGRYSAAERLAQEIATGYYRADAFRFIAMRLIESRQIERAIENIRNAEAVHAEVTAPIPNEVDVLWEQADTLNMLANSLHGSGDQDRAALFWSEAIAVAQRGQTVQDPLECGGMLWHIAEDMASSGHWDKAVEVAQSIRHNHKRQRALDGLQRMRQGGARSHFSRTWY